MKDHMPCYGRLFPSIPWQKSGKERADAVFGFVLQQPGTVALPPGITVDLEAWDRCVECREFASCRELSVSKTLLQMAVRN